MPPPLGVKNEPVSSVLMDFSAHEMSRYYWLFLHVMSRYLDFALGSHLAGWNVSHGLSLLKLVGLGLNLRSCNHARGAIIRSFKISYVKLGYNPAGACSLSSCLSALLIFYGGML